MYTGTGNSTVKRRVTGTADLPQGYQSSSIRTSGASGYWNGNNALGEISPDWVHLVDQTVLFSTGQSITGLTDVEDAIECVSQGDSGGAVYLQSGSTEATAVGIMSGTDDGGAGLTNCRNYYTPVKYIYYGGAIKLGLGHLTPIQMASLDCDPHCNQTLECMLARNFLQSHVERDSS
jgi:hypothetical protein